VLSSRAVDGHQMYFGGSVVKHHSTLSRSRLNTQQDIRILKKVQ